MDKDTTFIFRDGMNYAIREGRLISANSDLGELEKTAKGSTPDMGPDHPFEGNTESGCSHCSYPASEHPGYESDAKESSYIVTPNGLRGKVLGKTQDLWGSEQVTVRFENGRIAHLNVVDSFKYENVKEATTVKPVDDLEARLSQGSNDLEERVDELTQIIDKASGLVSTADLETATRLDGIVVSAKTERQHINDALTYLASEDAEAYEPPAPFRMAAYEQAGMGRDSSWLDTVTQDMVKEAEATDFEQVMAEEPELFVSDLGDGAVADTGTVRSMALSYIRTKTAGVLDDDLRTQYENVFLARVESARKIELENRKETMHKEAAQEEEQTFDLPDDFLW